MMKKWGIVIAFVASVVAGESHVVGGDAPCEMSIVGGGWAGIYAAYRLNVDSKTVDAGKLCVFEGRQKTGGRTYSVVDSNDELTVDIGAYRFGEDMHLPGDLIRDELKLPTRCYEPDCARDPEFNVTLWKIVDDDSAANAAGYETPIRLMTAALAAQGVRIFYEHVLVDLQEGAVEGGSTLVFDVTGGEEVRVDTASVFLNLPRKAITALPAASPLFSYDATAAKLLRACAPCGGETFEQIKVYAIYDDPWWLTKLGIEEGTFVDTNSTPGPPFVGRYHDGPMHRDAAGRVDGAGALELVYTVGELYPAISYYDKYRSTKADPLTVSHNASLLAETHAKLMTMHAERFRIHGVDPKSVKPPTSAIMGFWDLDNPLLTMPQSANFNTQVKQCPKETCLGDIDGHTYTLKTSDPTGGKKRIFLANNDYYFTGYQGTLCCWAEQSLKVTENILKVHFNMTKPAWLDKKYYADKIARM